MKLQPSLEARQRSVPRRRKALGLNQFINVAVAEKLSALETADYFRARAAQGSRPDFIRFLDEAGDEQPIDGDALPECRTAIRIRIPQAGSCPAPSSPRSRSPRRRLPSRSRSRFPPSRSIISPCPSRAGRASACSISVAAWSSHRRTAGFSSCPAWCWAPTAARCSRSPISDCGSPVRSPRTRGAGDRPRDVVVAPMLGPDGKPLGKRRGDAEAIVRLSATPSSFRSKAPASPASQGSAVRCPCRLRAAPAEPRPPAAQSRHRGARRGAGGITARRADHCVRRAAGADGLHPGAMLADGRWRRSPSSGTTISPSPTPPSCRAATSSSWSGATTAPSDFICGCAGSASTTCAAPRPSTGRS